MNKNKIKQRACDSEHRGWDLSEISMISFVNSRKVWIKKQQHTRLQIYAEYRSIAKNKNKKRNKKIQQTIIV